MFVRAKRKERAEARRLRREGMSLRRIARELGVCHSSVSIWVRDIPRVVGTPDEPPPPEPTAADLLPFRCCSRCSRMLPASAFNRSGEGRQWWCRECFRTYFRQRGDVHLEQVYATRARRRSEAAAFIETHLASRQCADCGLHDRAVLEFDHLGDKRANVATLRYAGTGLQALAAEVAKCDIVCTNCHRKRTASRADWIKADPEWRLRLSSLRPEVARNLRFVYSILEACPCVDCGEQDIRVLDFDHREPKERAVSKLAMNGYGYAALKREVAKCEIRCANCHRRRHRRLAETARRAA